MPGNAPTVQRITVDTSRAPTRGDPGAPVLLVEFADFRCHYCRKTVPVIERVLETYPHDVRLAFIHFPIVSPDSGRAAIAAEAAREQHQFWAMHDALYALQGRPLREEDLRNAAATMGLEVDRFSQDLRNPVLLTRVQADQDQARTLGIEATPTFVVNGRVVVGAVSFEGLTAIIDSELRATRGSRS